jgi:hypothetical protein
VLSQVWVIIKAVMSAFEVSVVVQNRNDGRRNKHQDDFVGR